MQLPRARPQRRRETDNHRTSVYPLNPRRCNLPADTILPDCLRLPLRCVTLRHALSLMIMQLSLICRNGNGSFRALSCARQSLAKRRKTTIAWKIHCTRCRYMRIVANRVEGVNGRAAETRGFRSMFYRSVAIFHHVAAVLLPFQLVSHATPGNGSRGTGTGTGRGMGIRDATGRHVVAMNGVSWMH